MEESDLSKGETTRVDASQTLAESPKYRLSVGRAGMWLSLIVAITVIYAAISSLVYEVTGEYFRVHPLNWWQDQQQSGHDRTGWDKGYTSGWSDWNYGTVTFGSEKYNAKLAERRKALLNPESLPLRYPNKDDTIRELYVQTFPAAPAKTIHSRETLKKGELQIGAEMAKFGAGGQSKVGEVVESNPLTRAGMFFEVLIPFRNSTSNLQVRKVRHRPDLTRIAVEIS